MGKGERRWGLRGATKRQVTRKQKQKTMHVPVHYSRQQHHKHQHQRHHPNEDSSTRTLKNTIQTKATSTKGCNGHSIINDPIKGGFNYYQKSTVETAATTKTTTTTGARRSNGICRRYTTLRFVTANLALLYVGISCSLLIITWRNNNSTFIFHGSSSSNNNNNNNNKNNKKLFENDLLLLPPPKSLRNLHRQQPSLSSSYSAVATSSSTQQQQEQGQRVLLEFCQRVLSRSVAQSNVLVVVPPPPPLPSSLTDNNNDNNNNLGLGGDGGSSSIGGSRYRHELVIDQARRENHTVHTLPLTADLDLNLGTSTDGSSSNNNNNHPWFLLSYFAASSSSTAAVDANDGNSNKPSVDWVLHPSRAGTFLQSSTLTYIVLHVRSFYKEVDDAGGNGAADDDDDDREQHLQLVTEGVEAAQTLLQNNYKLQILSSSHYFFPEDDASITTNNNNSSSSSSNSGDIYNDNKEEKSEQKTEPYQPNFLFKTKDDVRTYLSTGAQWAARAARQQQQAATQQNIEERKTKTARKTPPVQFEALLFATQGLDLAIPSRLSYVDIRNHRACLQKVPLAVGRCDAKITDSRGLLGHKGNWFQSCPDRHRETSLEFASVGSSASGHHSSDDGGGSGGNGVYLRFSSEVQQLLLPSSSRKQHQQQPRPNEQVELATAATRQLKMTNNTHNITLLSKELGALKRIGWITQQLPDNNNITMLLLPPLLKKEASQDINYGSISDSNNSNNNESNVKNGAQTGAGGAGVGTTAELWLGHSDPQKAEAACVRFHYRQEAAAKTFFRNNRTKTAVPPPPPPPKVACTTRIVKQHLKTSKQQQLYRSSSSSATAEAPVPINVLSILMDPLSRQQFQRSLPNTAALLQKLGFVHFPKYTVVGDNSGPNQAALFSGVPLQGGRDGIAGSQSHGGGDKTTSADAPPFWLWDRLRAQGYVTLKAEDGCIENSNMAQSLKPNTTHGEQLYRMFCFDYDRPNCLGREMAATHLVRYAQQFMAAYDENYYGETGNPNNSSNNDNDNDDILDDDDDSNKNEGATLRGRLADPSFSVPPKQQPWAAFLSFVDSHEDTSTLVSYLDETLVNFFQSIPLENTLVLFSSDHGLHYGPAFASVVGERERASPILYVRLPGEVAADPHVLEQRRRILQQNSAMWTTPFDVHETILDVTSSSNAATTRKEKRKDWSNDVHQERLGSSLVGSSTLPSSRTQCHTTPGIPKRFCDLLAMNQTTLTVSEPKCTFMREPPSVLSFYADIPRQNRPSWPKCSKRKIKQRSGSECKCTQNTLRPDLFYKQWVRCSMLGNKYPEKQHVTMMSCPVVVGNRTDWPLEMNISISTDNQLVNRSTKQRRLVLSKLLKPKRKDKYVDERSIIEDKEELEQKVEGGEEEPIVNNIDGLENQPNILFLEIDSVSEKASERTFPKTRDILRRHQMLVKENNDGKGRISCPTGFCSAMYTKTSVVGQNSIPNQVAALSGCTDKNVTDENMELHSNFSRIKTWCPKRSSRESPWLFDVVKNLGYISMFGEEFCYLGSKYIVQVSSFDEVSTKIPQYCFVK